MLFGVFSVPFSEALLGAAFLMLLSHLEPFLALPGPILDANGVPKSQNIDSGRCLKTGSVTRGGPGAPREGLGGDLGTFFDGF